MALYYVVVALILLCWAGECVPPCLGMSAVKSFGVAWAQLLIKQLFSFPRHVLHSGFVSDVLRASYKDFSRYAIVEGGLATTLTQHMPHTPGTSALLLLLLQLQLLV